MVEVMSARRAGRKGVATVSALSVTEDRFRVNASIGCARPKDGRPRRRDALLRVQSGWGLRTFGRLGRHAAAVGGGLGHATRFFACQHEAGFRLAVTPEGKHWLSGTLDGMLTFWEPVAQRHITQVLAHTRPVSAVRFAPDGKTLATASWDCNVVVWSNPGGEGEGRTFGGHDDLVTGCAVRPR